MTDKRLKHYLLSGSLTTLLFTILAIMQQFTPFGKETMLTVDLGQQYIDFFSLFRETILHSPEQLLYSFQKAIGGEMIGLWAYYLLSPFNLIFLLFKQEHLALAVTCITYLKLLSASLTFLYFTRHKYPQLSSTMAVTFSQCYAFMSYVIVFLLNIMWLDGLVFLPLIALGLDTLIRHNRSMLYTLSLAWLLMANYYIGYMTCLFLSVYALFVIAEQDGALSFKNTVKLYIRFVKQSVIATLMSAVVLVPTFMSLLSSKATHMKNDFNWETAHNLQNIASKLFIGSFNFDEMSKGSPNLYAGIIVSLFCLYFFVNRHIKFREKIVASIVLVFFGLAFYFNAIDRLWHGGQFPIWYHFRFSFMTSFFMIILAMKSFSLAPVRYSLKIILAAITSVTLFCFYYFWIEHYQFLTMTRIFVTLAFALVIILLVQWEQLRVSLKHGLLLVLVCGELLTNATFIFSELSYVDLSKFNDYVTVLDDSLTNLRHGSNDFYRIHTTFQRSKNEAMFTHFNGLNHFGSTIEANLPQLFAYLGLPDGSGFVNYSNGTLVTDDFFNIKYLIHPTKDSADHTKEDEYVIFPIAYDVDLLNYPIINTTPRYEIYENTQRLGLGMEVSESIVAHDTTFYDHNPIRNQELLLRLLDINGNGKPYFTEHKLTSPTLSNVEVSDEGDGDFITYTKTDTSDEAPTATLTFTFDTTSKNPFYFTLPSQLEADNAKLTLNDKSYKIYTPFRHRQVTNASYQTIQANQTLKLELLKDELKINSVKLYEFDEERFNTLIQHKQLSNLNITSFSHNHIEGIMTTANDRSYALLTIPYDKYWTATINGVAVQPIPVLNDTLMALPLTKGTHHITLHYFPYTIWIGLGVSLIGLLLWGGATFLTRHLNTTKKEKE